VALETLLTIVSDCVPQKIRRALYIRQVVFACEEYLAARVSEEYRFYIITSPVAAYYKEGFYPVRLTTTEEFVRAVKGGTGEAKAAGNYAASMYPAQKAQNKGYTQVLWLDAIEGRYIEEVGTMNIFFLIDGKLITPKLTGSVLNGVTRRSVIDLAKDQGVTVEERRISIDEVFEANKAGKLDEVFGSGTAAVISPVGFIHHKGESIEINNNETGPFAKKMFETITGIQYGEIEDPFGWTHKIRL
ncbi:MAG: branched-chain-amino-acid transaminase, partial [Balneolaceae bacterium]